MMDTMSVVVVVDTKFEEDLAVLMSALIQTKLYHWSSRKYGKHKALDELYDSLNENIDKFVEIHLGKTNSVPFKFGDDVLRITSPKTSDDTSEVKLFLNKLHKDIEEMNLHDYVQADLGLQNVLQDLEGHVAQATYLFLLE
jgi:DNA-binding ferritin-like protein